MKQGSWRAAALGILGALSVLLSGCSVRTTGNVSLDVKMLSDQIGAMRVLFVLLLIAFLAQSIVGYFWIKRIEEYFLSRRLERTAHTAAEPAHPAYEREEEDDDVLVIDEHDFHEERRGGYPSEPYDEDYVSSTAAQQHHGNRTRKPGPASQRAQRPYKQDNEDDYLGF